MNQYHKYPDYVTELAENLPLSVTQFRISGTVTPSSPFGKSLNKFEKLTLEAYNNDMWECFEGNYDLQNLKELKIIGGINILCMLDLKAENLKVINIEAVPVRNTFAMNFLDIFSRFRSLEEAYIEVIPKMDNFDLYVAVRSLI